ncbi:MAG: hypothetical protein IKS60_04425 [Lachnospiraceae bacterium]|nr:hypothetical protein [Lachnospiraceae bacterium]MBR5066456.1 hypothetical protein [Lachnospiraceae bacterium]MBR5917484.1 hypothetical protein [Lachnospiraceae bacterium]
MKSRRYYNLAEAANFIMVILIYISVVEIWDVMYKVPFNFVLPAGTVIMLLFSLAIRMIFGKMKSFLNNFVVYAITHVLLVLGIVFVPIDPLQKMAFAFVLFIIFITNMRSYFKAQGQGFDYVGVVLVLLPAIGYLVADILSLRTTMFAYFVIGVAFVMLYYFRLFFSNAHLLSIERKNNEKMPLDDMLRNDSKLAIPFIVMSFVIMVVAKIEKLDSLALFLYDKFAAGLRFVLGYVLKFIGWLFDLLIRSDEEIPVAIMEETEVVDDAANPVFNVISIIIFIFLALVLLFVFVKIMISIIKSLSVRREIQTQTIEDEGMIEIREKIVRKRNEKKEKLSKIRRIYKKAIEKNIKKGYELKKYQTPRERAEDIQKQMNEDIFELNSLYEKERYGQFND